MKSGSARGVVAGPVVSLGDPPGRQGPGREVVSQIPVLSHLFAQSGRWPRPRPSWDDEGGLLSLAAVIPRLPSNPSKSPGKKLLLIGLSAAKPTKMSGATSGCLRGSLHNNWRTLPQWSAIREESSPIKLFVSCWDSISLRRDRMYPSILSRASSS